MSEIFCYLRDLPRSRVVSHSKVDWKPFFKALNWGSAAELDFVAVKRVKVQRQRSNAADRQETRAGRRYVGQLFITAHGREEEGVHTSPLSWSPQLYLWRKTEASQTYTVTEEDIKLNINPFIQEQSSLYVKHDE